MITISVKSTTQKRSVLDGETEAGLQYRYYEELEDCAIATPTSEEEFSLNLFRRTGCQGQTDKRDRGSTTSVAI